MTTKSQIVNTLSRMLQLMEAYGRGNWHKAIRSLLHQAEMGHDISTSYNAICGGMGSFTDYVFPQSSDTQQWSADMTEFDLLRGELYELVYRHR